MRRESSIVVGVVAGDRVPSRDFEAWARVQEAEPSLESPFFRPEFTEIVASARRDVEVAIVRWDAGEPAFFPYQRGSLGRALPVGTRLSDYQGLVARGTPRIDAPSVLRSCGLRVFRFDAVVAAQSFFSPFHRRERFSPCLDLSRGFTAFAAERASTGSDQVRDIQKQVERLEAERGPVRVEVNAEDPANLECLLRWKSDQYRRTGAVDIFSFPWVRDVVRRVHESRRMEFAGPLSMLYVGDQPVAGHLGLRSGSTWHYWLPAYDRSMAKHAPGLILLLKMAEAAAGLGVDTIDLGKGEALYKRRLSNAGVELAEGSVTTSSLASAAGAGARAAWRLVERTPFARRLELRRTRKLFG